MTRMKILLLLILLAACEPAATNLPTRARLATATDAPPATEVGQTVFDPTATFTETSTPTATATPNGMDADVTEVAVEGTEPANITTTITYTPSSTITTTPTQTYTPAPTIGPEERPLVALAFTAAAATVLPTDYVIPGFEGTDVSASTATPGTMSGFAGEGSGGGTTAVPSNCAQFPAGGFGSVYQANADLAAQLGCPTSSTVQEISAARQPFQNGTMLWLSGEIVVLYDLNSTLESYPDTFTEGVDPETSSDTPPNGLFTPVRGFLKVWNNQPNVRNGLGWATAPEQGATATVLSFDNGRMVWLAGSSQILVLFNGSWRAYTGTY